MNTQERRAISLQIAAQLIGQIPNGRDLDNGYTFLNYDSLAAKIEQYIIRGGTILEPNPPGENESNVGEVPIGLTC
jgi:hypothetical protein